MKPSVAADTHESPTLDRGMIFWHSVIFGTTESTLLLPLPLRILKEQVVEKLLHTTYNDVHGHKYSHSSMPA